MKSIGNTTSVHEISKCVEICEAKRDCGNFEFF